MTRFTDVIRGWFGWCPMDTAGRQEPAKSIAGEPHDRDTAGAGPVERRTALFLYLTLAVVGLSWITGIVALPYLPEIIPVHWNIYGEPDGFAGRLAGTFGLPAIMTLVALLLVVLPRFERMREQFEESRDIYTMVVFAAMCLLLGIHITALLSSAGLDLPVAVAFPVLLGFFFIVIGSLMPSIRRNTTVGFRLPWTVRDDTVWRRTHEHGGPVFVIAGILIILASTAAGAAAMPVAFGIIVIACVYITVWSYRLARAGTTEAAE
ncbi:MULTISPECIES: SdpI family protein [unclassified Methanoregula]|uniref:SdpI family protein n=1 Tax=unclassified Methanoregula TaxID=2649730 RepID=UPI0009C4E4A3|nr:MULTISPECIES: SdpI family protein [unclassified Methanoregula]OPX64296.1 MAG: hypothetical protein A4E33_01325 [Methanoregula sp. PtaB.Bin085]OPY33579.1 MAG: hypothetical protein A4E34_01902 [Methanoregula sp. PtaU1.Bin006]